MLETEKFELAEKEAKAVIERKATSLKKAAAEIANKLREGQESAHYLLARFLMTRWRFKTLAETGEVLVYDNGVYVPAEAAIGEVAETLLRRLGQGDKATTGCVREVIGHIQRSTYVSRDEFNANPNLLNVENGVLNLQTLELTPHRPDFLSTIRIPISYDPNASCPLIEKFLSEIVKLKDIPLLEEVFGWCLDTGLNIRRLPLLEGEGANGKTTYMELLRNFLGRPNCSAASMQRLAGNPFAAATLDGKLANICTELSSRDLRETALLKALTGGDTIQAEHKYGKPFTFQNKAKLLFAANRLPRIYDDVAAVWQRLMVVNFPNKFVGEKSDKDLLSKLTIPKELSGLLNRALKAHGRLKAKGDFSYTESVDSVRDRYILMSDPVQAFFEDQVETESEIDIYDQTISGPWTSKEALYQAFVVYCKNNHIPTISIQSFGREIKRRKLAVEGQHQGHKGWRLSLRAVKGEEGLTCPQ